MRPWVGKDVMDAARLLLTGICCLYFLVLSVCLWLRALLFCVCIVCVGWV